MGACRSTSTPACRASPTSRSSSATATSSSPARSAAPANVAQAAVVASRSHGASAQPPLRRRRRRRVLRRRLRLRLTVTAAVVARPRDRRSRAATQTETSSCTRCPLAATRTQVVFGFGDPAAELMFVGEAPGFHEDQQGVPFVGAGREAAREAARRDRARRATTSTSRTCSSAGRRGTATRSRRRSQACEPHLFHQIELIRPTRRRDARQLRDEAPLRQAGAASRRCTASRRRSTLGGQRGHALPALPPGRRALHAVDADGARGRLRAAPGAARRAGGRRPRAGRAASSSTIGAGARARAGRPARPLLSRAVGDPLRLGRRDRGDRRARSRAELAPGDVVTSRASSARARRPSCAARAARSASPAPVTSPTFTIGHRYEGDARRLAPRPLPLHGASSSAEWGDLEPYFDDAIVFVEWPEAAAAGSRPCASRCGSSMLDETTRRIVIEGDVDIQVSVVLILAFDTATDQRDERARRRRRGARRARSRVPRRCSRTSTRSSRQAGAHPARPRRARRWGRARELHRASASASPPRAGSRSRSGVPGGGRLDARRARGRARPARCR